MEALILRSIGFAAVLTLGGAVIFDLLVWKAAGPARMRNSEVFLRYSTRWRRMTAVAWGFGTAAWGVGAIRLEEERGVALFAVLALVVAGAYRVLHGRFRPPGQDDPRLVRSVAEALMLALLLLAVALTGHARLSSAPGLKVTVAFVHVTAAAAWIGGLASLLLAVVPAVRVLEEDTKVVLMAPVVARLSNLAVASIAALVATGTYSSWQAVGGLDGLGTAYGAALLAKLGAFVMVLSLGAVNKQWTKPRLLALARTARARAFRPARVAGRGPLSGRTGHPPSTPEVDPSTIRLLTRLVLAEVTLVVAVLGLTAYLVGLSPPASVTSE
jgi:putative copper export protein